MERDIRKLREKIKKQSEEMFEVDESDIPVHERYVKEEDIRALKKKKK